MSDSTHPPIRILFVDDEPAILAALQNLLRRRRRVWDMRFAPGGHEALAMLRAEAFDVVVSDLRMPGIDGAALLAEVRGLQPWAIRIVLSGHAERATLMRAVAVAHQLISKPCEVDHLVQVIERACSIQRAVPSREMAALAGPVGGLPVAPGVMRELERLLASPRANARDVACVVARDPALTAKVLQLANSAFFGEAHQVASVATAVSYLGIEALAELVRTPGVFDTTGGIEIPLGSSVDAMQAHALETALVARALAPADKRDLAFTAGLLHDIGRIVLGARTPDKLMAITQTAHATGQPVYTVERATLGTTHADVGAHLLAMWGIPLAIVEAVACHHEPGRFEGEGADIGAIVNAAELLIDEVTGAERLGLDAARLERAGVPGDHEDWRVVTKSTLGLMELTN